MADQLSFNDSLSLAGINAGVTNLTGSVTIDYSTNPPSVTGGSLSLTAAGTLAAQSYTNLTVVQTGTSGGQPVYTLTGSNSVTSIHISYTGQLPSSMTATVGLLGTGVQVASGSGTVTSTVVCFASGTLIETARGPVAVEHLAVGDLVATDKGTLRPVRWIGHRTLDCSSHPDTRAVWPIRISAHAFGDNRPERDLYLSPHHSVCVSCIDDVLIPASSLLNGSTIARSPVETVTYWHIELDDHDILLANGMPSESYLEMGNRKFFADADAVALQALPDGTELTHDAFCRPFAKSGPIIDFLRMRLANRAKQMGWNAGHDVDLRLTVDGQDLPGIRSGSFALFLFPADAKDVRLRSDTFTPFDHGSSDTRTLGVNIHALSLRATGVGQRAIALDDPRLFEGFHTPETVNGQLLRWTNGDAVLDPALWQDMAGSIVLEVEIDLSSVRHWHGPAMVQSSETQWGTPLRLVG